MFSAQRSPFSICCKTNEKWKVKVTSVQFSSVQSLSRVRLFATPWIAARQVSLSITNSQSSLRLTSIESVMPSSHLILCRPLFFLPPVPPSIRVFSNESTLRMRWPKYWSFSFSIIPFKEHPGLISFRMDWLDLLAVQGTLRSLHLVACNSLQHHGLNCWVQDTGVGSLSLPQGIFPTQGSSPGLPHCREILYQLSHQGSPWCWILLTLACL